MKLYVLERVVDDQDSYQREIFTVTVSDKDADLWRTKKDWGCLVTEMDLDQSIDADTFPSFRGYKNFIQEVNNLL